MTKATNYETALGQQIVSYKGEIIGRLTSIEIDCGRVWGLIDETFEVNIQGSEFILDILGIARLANPELEISYLRLHPNA